MKTIILLLTLAIGIFFPQGYVFSFLLEYILMGLLLFAFLDIRIEKSIIHKSHFYILAANLSLPLLLYVLINSLNHQIAQAAFITALAPTATAAPVVISLMKKQVEYVAFSVLLTNVVVAVLVPFLLTNLVGGANEIDLWSVLFPVLIVFSVPLALGQLLKLFMPTVHSFLLRFKDDSFYLLMGGIYLGTANASHYLRTEMNQSLEIVFYVGIISLLICFFNFVLGTLFGSNKFSIEGGQSLGQKNNGFTVWLALTFISPLAVLGPVFYVLFQNLFISWELHHYKNYK
jgi:bile acid:Na+ symporter, BASS family